MAETSQDTSAAKSAPPAQAIRPAPFQPPPLHEPRKSRRPRPATLIVYALLGASALAAWFVLTGRSVYLEIRPPEAEVVIDGGFSLKLADRYLIRSGDYTVRIRAEGYHPLAGPLAVADADSQHFRFELRKLPGSLRVSAGGVAAAAVAVDGADRGVAPLLVDALEPGEHVVRVSAERYLPHEEKVVIEGRGIEQSLEAALTPAWAEVSITSAPAGADVYVDEQIAGKTPLTAEILHGRRELRVHLPGFKAFQDKMDVKANEPLAIPEIVLEPADAVVALDSRPSRATVTVNGEYRGQTPLEIALEPGQVSKLRLFREGFRPAGRELTLASGEKKSLTVDLDAELVTVEFSAEPADAELLVDGQPRGAATQNLQLTTSPHRITVRKPGFVDFETTITPREGIPQQVRAILKSEAQAKLESIKPVIKSPTGQSLKLFRPDETFTMGASRREPGRRANETLRTARLARPFYLGLHEVTNAQFRAWKKDHSSGALHNQNLDGIDQPAVRVAWQDAALYCNWLSEQDSLAPFYRVENGAVTGFDPRSPGYRLPTEAEWEWAARSIGGGGMLRFPWGDAMPAATKSGNFADRSADTFVGTILRDYDDGFPVSAPVGSFPANARGLFDIGGNAAEWVHDFYDIAVEQSDAALDPLGPESGEHHVIRGSSWRHGGVTELRLSFRDYGDGGRDDVGFRVARYLE
jgi:formylglycine-generating enzyme required for sulfatase activity